MMNPKDTLTAALNGYKYDRLLEGDLLEDIIDDIQFIVDSITNEWLYKESIERVDKLGLVNIN